MFGYKIIKNEEILDLQQKLSITQDELVRVQTKNSNYVKRIEDLSSENDDLKAELLKLKKQKVELLTDIATEPLKVETGEEEYQEDNKEIWNKPEKKSCA